MPAKRPGRLGQTAPGSDAYWENKVDPDRVLDPADRQRRAKALKKAHFTRLAIKSSLARSKTTKAKGTV